MPVSFPAHQGPLLPLKMIKPKWFDGTALVVSSAAPDLLYGFGRPDELSSHSMAGIITFCVPFAVVYAMILRRWAVDGLFASLPDLGPFKLRSWRVLGRRQPHPLITVSSAFFGAASHVFVDSFTHYGRWGSNLLGLNRMLTTPLGSGSLAKHVQYLGHTFGSLIGLAMFVLVANRYLHRWYGRASLDAARGAPADPNAAPRTAFVLALSTFGAFCWSNAGEASPLFALGSFTALGLLIAGLLSDPRSPFAPSPALPASAPHTTTPSA